MKTAFCLTLTMASLLGHSLLAQKISVDKVPSAVLSTFKMKFPQASNVQWEMEGNNYESGFKAKGQEISAVFQANGDWEETEKSIDKNALPQNIQASLKKDYSNWKVTEASKIESVKNGDCYEAEIKSGKESFDLLFSTDGKLISKTKVGADK